MTHDDSIDILPFPSIERLLTVLPAALEPLQVIEDTFAAFDPGTCMLPLRDLDTFGAGE
jgi:hypothetical protein